MINYTHETNRAMNPTRKPFLSIDVRTLMPVLHQRMIYYTERAWPKGRNPEIDNNSTFGLILFRNMNCPVMVKFYLCIHRHCFTIVTQCQLCIPNRMRLSDDGLIGFLNLKRFVLHVHHKKSEYKYASEELRSIFTPVPTEFCPNWIHYLFLIQNLSRSNELYDNHFVF